MAKGKALPVLLLAALGLVAFRSLLPSSPGPAFLAARSRAADATTLHRGCRRLTSQAGAAGATAGAAAAVLRRAGPRSGVAAHYKVTLETPEGTQSFECPDDAYILDQAEEEGIELPYSCRAGSCSSCAGKLVSGTVDASDNAFLDDAQLGEGYCLLCTTYPTSDVTIRTHCEAEL